jgi:diguanylate cyclase
MQFMPFFTSFADSKARWRSLRTRWSFLSGNLWPVALWPLLALIILALGWAVLLKELDKEKRATENFALQQAATLARSYAEHLKRESDGIDQIILLVREQWEASGGNLRLESFREKGLIPPDAEFNVSIVDAHGIRQSTTGVERVNRSNFDVNDRPYFQALKNATSDILFTGAPTTGRSSGHAVIHFARRLEDKTGNFAGVILSSVQLDYFTASYDVAVMQHHGLLGILGRDGKVSVARIGQKLYPVEIDAVTPGLAMATNSGSLHLDGQHWFIDQRSRYVGWQKVEGFPHFALTGLDESEALVAYVESRATSIKHAIFASAVVVLFGLVGFVLSLRLAWRKHQMEQMQATYRMATEGSHDGFFIARPLRNDGGGIVDFDIVDCNQRGADFFRLRPEQLIGQRLSTSQDKAAYAQSLAILQNAVAQGDAQGEVEMLATEWGRQRSLQLKAVRSEDHLAVTLRDITAEKAHVRELERRSNEDALTALPNRLWAQTYLPRAVDSARAKPGRLALLFIDLDGFKAVNDNLGHASGDDVLRAAAARLKEAVRPHDHVVRWGGDEFVVILEHIHQRSDAAQVASRIIQAFEESFRLRKGVVSVGTSVGISIFPDDAASADNLIHNADAAMYAVKTSGKDHYQFFDPQAYEALRAQQKLEEEFRLAIEQDHFVMYYQPRVDMTTGKTTSMEALVRWAHATRGMISPVEFIPLAERSGLILRLGDLVMDKVCAQLARWASSGAPVVPVSINVSSRQINEADIGQIVSRSLNRHNINPGLVELELTESTMMDDTTKVGNALRDIRGMGIKLLVDDFGTGYSSLAQLQRLDVDVLKVDRAFTIGLGEKEKVDTCFKAIITMAHALGMRVVAEGVETERQLKVLHALNCDEIQGFYVAQPLAAKQHQSDMLIQLQGLPRAANVHRAAFGPH